MKIYTLILGIWIFFSTDSIAQKNSGSDSHFNLIYEKIAVEVAGKSPQLALEKADSLFLASKDGYRQFKSLMLKANIYAQIGDYAESIQIAKKAEEIAAETSYYSWQARIAGFISTQYRMSGLYSEAKKYLDKGILYSKKVNSESESQKLLSFIYQEKADLASLEREFAQAVLYLKISGAITEKFPKVNKMNYHLLSLNDAYLAEAFYQLGCFDSSRYYYDRATHHTALSGFEDPKLNGFILIGKGKLDLLYQNEKLGLKKIHQALVFANQSGSLKIKELGNEELIGYYQNHEDSLRQYQDYAQVAIETLKTLSDTKQKVADYALKESAKEKKSLHRLSLFYVILIGLLLLGLGVVIIRNKRKRKRESLLYQHTIFQLQNDQQAQIESAHYAFTESNAKENLPVAQMENKVSKKKNLMSKETEEFLMDKLSKFEKGMKFTDKNMSVTMLSEILGTNTKYLTYIISKNRNKNFNQYINHLRIQYIVQKMQESPEYLQYKISSMADECGFSSHGKFTEIFKKEIGITPSVFMECLQKEDLKRLNNLDDLNWD